MHHISWAFWRVDLCHDFLEWFSFWLLLEASLLFCSISESAVERFFYNRQFLLLGELLINLMTIKPFTGHLLVPTTCWNRELEDHLAWNINQGSTISLQLCCLVKKNSIIFSPSPPSDSGFFCPRRMTLPPSPPKNNPKNPKQQQQTSGDSQEKYVEKIQISNCNFIYLK